MLPRFRVPNPKSGPLSDGGWRYAGRKWAVDFDHRGHATCIVAWPPQATAAAGREAVRRATALMEALEEGEERV